MSAAQGGRLRLAAQESLQNLLLLQEASTSAPGENSTTAALMESVEEDVDNTLWWFSRICSAVGLIAIIVCLCSLPFVIPLVKKKLVAPGDGKKRSRFRPHKIKKCLWNFFCCGACCKDAHVATGFDRLRPCVDRTLRLTFMRASNLQRRMSFYFEVWTEPIEGYPRNTSLQEGASVKVDLGNEVMELPWCGDEDVLVVQAIEMNAKGKTAKDVPLGEVRVDRASIDRYAREAADGSDTITSGTRLFDLTGLGRKAMVQRNLRFKSPNPMAPAIMKRMQEIQGFDPPDLNDVENLREENRQLRTQTGRTADEIELTSPMTVAIRIEIVDRQESNVDESMFQSHDGGAYGP